MKSTAFTERKESFVRSSIHPLKKCHIKQKQLLMWLPFRPLILSLSHSHKRKNYQRSTIKKQHNTNRENEIHRAKCGSDRRKTDFLFMFWFERVAVFSLVCAYMFLFFSFLNAFISNTHWCEVFISKLNHRTWNNRKITSLNESLSEWMNEWIKNHLKLYNINEYKRIHTRKLVKTKQQKSSSTIYLFRLIYFENVLIKVTFCSLNYSSAHLHTPRSRFVFISNNFYFFCFVSFRFVFIARCFKLLTAENFWSN